MPDIDCPYVKHLLACAAIREQQAHLNARPFGGLEEARARFAWQGKIAEQGFARYTCKAEGGSTEPAPPSEWNREYLGSLREIYFGGNQERFNSWFSNRCRKAGRLLTPGEASLLLRQGPARQDVPRKQGGKVRVRGGVWRA